MDLILILRNYKRQTKTAFKTRKRQLIRLQAENEIANNNLEKISKCKLIFSKKIIKHMNPREYKDDFCSPEAYMGTKLLGTLLEVKQI